MPLYWSSSKVGALPQGPPSSNSKTKRSAERKGRRKGITMEDLKKQTALRLAQEQQQQNAYPFQPQEPVALQVVHPTPQRSEPTVAPPPSAPPAQRLTQTAALTDRIYHSSNIQAPASLNSVQAQAAAAADAKSKLPHGLTVLELKEMTKARLHSECTDIPEDAEVAAVHSPSNLRLIPEYQDGHSRTLQQPSPFHRPSSACSRSSYPEDHRDQWSQDGTRGDLWDAASVGTASSDYIGSELGGDTGFRVQPDDYAVNYSYSAGESFSPEDPSMVVNRSFSAGAEVLPSPSTPYNNFDYNRRRAATMSPRLSLGEAVQVKGPGIPSFSSIRQSPSVPSSSSMMESPPFGNRSRTLSLPAMNAVAPSPVDSPVHGLSHTFETQEPLNDSGLVGGTNLFPDNMGLAGDHRNRAATWSAGRDDEDIFLFGNGPEALSDDLASILKLSGCEDKS